MLRHFAQNDKKLSKNILKTIMERPHTSNAYTSNRDEKTIQSIYQLNVQKRERSYQNNYVNDMQYTYSDL